VSLEALFTKPARNERECGKAPHDDFIAAAGLYTILANICHAAYIKKPLFGRCCAMLTVERRL